MAQIKIAQLTNQTTLSDTDKVIVETATSTNKMTVGKFKELVLASHLAENASKHITESGVSSNGRYIKFDDGTLIMHSNSIVLDFTNAVEGFVVNTTWVFPVLGIGGSMSVSGMARGSSGGNEGSVNLTFTGNGNVATTGVPLRARALSSFSSTVDLNLIAIGRWK